MRRERQAENLLNSRKVSPLKQTQWDIPGWGQRLRLPTQGPWFSPCSNLDSECLNREFTLLKQRPQAANNVFLKRYGDSQVIAVKKLDMEENLKCVLFGVEKSLMTYKISLLKNKGKWY